VVVRTAEEEALQWAREMLKKEKRVTFPANFSWGILDREGIKGQ